MGAVLFTLIVTVAEPVTADDLGDGGDGGWVLAVTCGAVNTPEASKRRR